MGNIQSEMSIEQQRTRRVLNLVTGAILFFTVLLYAGFRGYNAYHHKPAIMTNFVTASPVHFPAVTFCPLVNTVLIPLACVTETALVATSNCMSTVTNNTVNIEGVVRNCITFNSNDNNALSSSTTNDELAVRVYINASQVPPDEPIAALVMLHDGDEAPEIEAESSFLADVGELTEVWVSLYEIHRINGAVEDDYIATVSAAEYQPTSPQDPTSVMDVDIQFIQQGKYVSQEYYVYTTYNWFGEVGGFACLLMFLQITFVWLVMLVVGCVKGKGQKFENMS